MKWKVALGALAVIALLVAFTQRLVNNALPPLVEELPSRPDKQNDQSLVWWSELTESGQGQYSVVRLDLQAPEYAVNLLINSATRNAPEKADSRLELPQTMARVGNFLAAINATPYTLPGKTPQETESWRSFIPGASVALRGFAKMRDQSPVGSGPAAPSYPIFWINGAGQAGFSLTAPPPDAALAMSAYHWLLKDGELGNSIRQYSDLNYRSALGLSSDGRWLYLLVCGPKTDGEGAGVSLTELARYLLKLGVANAMNLDGGSSTSMVLRTENGFLLTPPPKKILSRPIPVMIGVTPQPDDA